MAWEQFAAAGAGLGEESGKRVEFIGWRVLRAGIRLRLRAQNDCRRCSSRGIASTRQIRWMPNLARFSAMKSQRRGLASPLGRSAGSRALLPFFPAFSGRALSARGRAGSFASLPPASRRPGTA